MAMSGSRCLPVDPSNAKINANERRVLKLDDHVIFSAESIGINLGRKNPIRKK